MSRKTRKRVIAPKLLFVPLFCVALVSHHIWSEDGVADVGMEITSLALVAIAATGRIWASAFISGKKDSELVVDGPYAIVRNPLYMFSMLGFIGAGLAFEQITFAILFTAVFFATHLPAIFAEERFLHERFGAQFEEYVRRVPRLIPRSWKPNCPLQTTFTSSAYSRAVVDSTLIIGMFLVAHIVEWGHLHRVLPVYFYLP
jgi:protein-S-isoprenylcysteine O-methyltransferase Ste14